MNMFKKNEGFTLVELIVVIAILAILAAVAVPAYSGYITKAQEASDYTQLDSMKTAIAFAVAEQNAAGNLQGAVVDFTDLTDIAVTVEVPTGTDAVTTVDISDLYGADDYDAQSDATGAKLEGGKWTLTKGE